MSRSKKRNNKARRVRPPGGKSRSNPAPTPPAGGPESGVIRQTRSELLRLIAKGKQRKALQVAKRVHKQIASAESENLLVEAYAARLEDLSAAGQHQEAAALADLVSDRFGADHPLFVELRLVERVRSGNLDELLAPLADPGIAPEQRTSIENMIRRELCDPTQLARSQALPPDHPLRSAAAVLARAFEAVTSGPVQDDEITLREISRHSPLGPWKHLVHAICCYHRREDASCERHLLAIDEQAAPARLIPAVRALMNDQQAQSGSGARERLRTAVHGNSSDLWRTFDRLDKALARRDSRGVFPLIQGAVAECGRARPELVPRLKQHLSVRAWMLKLPSARLCRAMDGPAPRDAPFWRLLARAQELSGLTPQACFAWEEFRRGAIAEGWFKARGKEEAALYLHMASLLTALGPRELAQERLDVEGCSPGVHDYYFLYPESLYKRATRIDPHPETFRLWLEWARDSKAPWREMDKIAKAWHKAAPRDPRPLLLLVESAEERRAFQKALGYLEEAECANLLDPEVRRARLRLELARFRRHVRQRKPHLAAKDLSILETLPDFGDGDRPALLEALRWIQVTTQDGREAGHECQDRVCRQLGGACAGLLFLRGAAVWCDLPRDRWPAAPKLPRSRKQGETLLAAARAAALGHSVGFPIPIPPGWRRRLQAELAAPTTPVDAHGLRCLAETAGEEEDWSLVYSASGAGLRRGGTAIARFLLLRAESLPFWQMERMGECLAVAAELARRQGDTKLVAEASELRRDLGLDRFEPFGEPAGSTNSRLSQETVNRLLSREGAAVRHPDDRLPDPDLDEVGGDISGLESEFPESPEAVQALLEFLSEAADEKTPARKAGRRQGQKH